MRNRSLYIIAHIIDDSTGEIFNSNSTTADKFGRLVPETRAGEQFDTEFSGELCRIARFRYKSIWKAEHGKRRKCQRGGFWRAHTAGEGRNRQ